MKPASQYPELAASILASLEAINFPHLDAMRLGMKANPNYDLDFAQLKLEEAQRHYLAKQNKPAIITDDPAIRSDEEYFAKFAKWAGIHKNWPAVLFKPHEMEAWKAYYFREIALCNQQGLYFREVLQWEYNMSIVPEWLRKRVNSFNIICEVSISMLIKYRWYRFTMSRFHKQDRLDTVEKEFQEAIQSLPYEATIPVQ